MVNDTPLNIWVNKRKALGGKDVITNIQRVTVLLFETI